MDTTITEDDLVRWLDREARQSDITQAELRAYLKAVVLHLANEQHMPLATLARARHQLAKRIDSRIEELRAAVAERKFKQLVLGGGWEVTADLKKSFAFLLGSYAGSATDRYQGKWRFDCHFYPVVAKLKDGTRGIQVCSRYRQPSRSEALGTTPGT